MLLAMAVLRNILLLIFGHLLPLVRTHNIQFLPCDSDEKATMVNCSDRSLKTVPFIKSNSVVLLTLNKNKIRHVEWDAFAYVPNLQTLEICGNCQPGLLRDLNDNVCNMELHPQVFKSLHNLTFLYLSGNSITTIPWLPETLKVLDLQNNHIFQITEPLKTPNLEVLFLTKNCFYANPCNQSFHISETVLRELHKLKNLTLGYNNYTSLPKGLPPSLEILDLKENTITEILDGAFSNLTRLKVLNLEWNCQRCDHAARPCFSCPGKLPLKLHSNSFSGIGSITFLSLRGNSLETFPEGIFRHLKNLKGLDLSDNLLACAIQNGTFFADLKGLTWISLIYNYKPLVTFETLTLSPSISNITGLEQLFLSGNFFRQLSPSSFDVLSKLKNLTLLELRMNFMTNCNFTALTQLPSLVEISLSQNMLSFLPCTSRPPTETVTQKACQVRNLYSQDFHDQPRIVRKREVPSAKEIWEPNQSNVQGMNKMPKVPSVYHFKYHFCQNKLSFDLSQNNIMYLNKHVFLGIEDVICLDLSFNYINQALQGGQFNSTKKLVFLNLSYNRLDLYYSSAFSELKSTLRVLDVSYNDFHFKMRGMGHSFLFLSQLTNLEVLSLANNAIESRVSHGLSSSSLKYLYFSGNLLNVMWDSDNNKYNSFFHNLTSLIFLDISQNNLTLISKDILCNLPGSIETLIISKNQLNYFPWQYITALGNLCYLDLSYNKIFYLPHKETAFQVSLSHLDLSHNELNFIPKPFFKEFKSLQYLYLDHNRIKELDHQYLPSPIINGSGIKLLTLHDNPFKCDCDTSWFVEFLRSTPVEILYMTTKMRCEFPESQQGKSILSMDKHSCQDIYGSLAFFLCSVLTVTFTVLPLLKHLYGWDMWYCLQVLWASYKGYSLLAGTDSQNRYDAFVVFDTNNKAMRDWVYNELIVHLENLGHRRFILCLEERDWTPGLSCIENLHNAVSNSVKTLFVLSSNADGGDSVNGVVRQAFYMVQQRLLEEKVDAAVLVLLDEMFPKLKYLQLRKRLCRKSVLTWPKNPKAHPLFWNEMRMALSSDNLKLYDDNMSQSFI